MLKSGRALKSTRVLQHNHSNSDIIVRRSEVTLRAINVRFASRRTAAKFASLFDEAGGVVRDMTEIDLTGEHA
jgi:hypothetical protein